ncbi:SAM-dependent methyltransferase [Peterkaempfera bronchialis]|uniref:SAM-dependent methyltransferase n=1 Tax=Peterkaempfera bronchialis TaxID=2126346 RepID=A0A345T4H1_9ACTN|nr:SAM-dependent methyltransferase [Peterkaempfera bronchialis]AXI80876.1 SAM-dependent methyltransferase [Peterkaempfera bronchialis]
MAEQDWQEWEGRVPGDLRTDVAHPARMYDYYLGGKDNFPADREAAEAVIQAYPASRVTALANRAFLGRAVRHVAGELGIRQFLDVGTGIPTQGNTNEVAHEVAPDARVLYVDNDPIVLSHARALLAHADEGQRTQVMLGDLRDPAAITAEARKLLDFDRPVALMLVAILHFVRDEEEPAEIVRALLDPLPSGSALILTHATSDYASREAVAMGKDVYNRATAPFLPRDRQAVEAFFAGTEPVEPGLVQAPWWRPDGEVPKGSEVISLYGGVGVKR